MTSRPDRAPASRSRFLGLAALALLAAATLAPAARAQAPLAGTGVIVMHGKGGGPDRLVRGLAASLADKGAVVANLDMPWSGRRDYDVDVAAADAEIAAALQSLRGQGAKKVFVAGHSQGGVFALHVGGRHAVDGIVAIAPGGNVANQVFRQQLGPSVDLARRLVAEGKGDEKVQLLDYENARGAYPIVTTPAIYLAWFDPEGAMNQVKASRAMNPAVPVLFIVPSGDYPGLLRVRQQMYDALPRNPLTRLYEPAADHRGAPAASREEVARWIAEVAAQAAR